MTGWRWGLGHGLTQTNKDMHVTPQRKFHKHNFPQTPKACFN